MDYPSKLPALAGKRTIILLILTGILLIGMPIFGFFIPKTEAERDSVSLIITTPKSLVLMESNTLIPVASPSTQRAKTTTHKLKVIVTAYSSTVEQTDSTPFITAAGTSVRDGIVATNLLPFGTIIKIPEVYGDKIFIVEDRMNPRNSNHVDIWFPSYGDALDFGAKRTYIEVL